MPKLPKPTDGAVGKVTCGNCGTNKFYTIEDMLNHKKWCKAAKAKTDTVAKGKKAHSNQVKRRR